MKKIVTKIFSLVLLLSLITAPVTAKELSQTIKTNPDLAPVGAAGLTDKFKAEESVQVISLDKESIYIVLFEGDSLVVRSGGALNLDSKSTTKQDYLQELAVKREGVLAAAEAKLGRSLEVTHVYDVILNGAAVKMSAEEAAKLAGMPGIRQIMLSETQTLDTDAGPMWIGAGGIWDGTAVPDGTGNKGEGILVGMIDSGINFDHPSFSATPADSYVYEWTGDYLGVCHPTTGDPAYATACNDKLVGAYTYTDDNPAEPITPEDSNGHGTHTASTVAGNTVELEFFGETVTISGVAPHAQIIAYDACYPTPTGGSCAGDDLLAAVQQAVLDGVDIINYSISGGETPYSDPVEMAFLEAFGAGVVVSASAGNNGPDAATVGHRSPWVITTAASTHNRKFTNDVDFSNPLYENIYTLSGEVPFSTAVVASDVVYAGEDTGNEEGCVAFPAGFFADSIALIKRGTCNFSVKINNAAAAGANGVFVFTDDRAPGPMSATGTTIPNVMLDIPGTLGLEIAAWVAAQTDETVSISAFGPTVDDAFGDIMADFSSRGPNQTFDVLKPDVSAPGVDILAAVQDGTIPPSSDAEYDLYQGTSMSSPHDAGAAALLYAQHPDWTPAMIKSALMLTAYDGLLKEDKTTPADLFDMGAGRVALELAGLTGLVMDETYDNMLAADPDAGGDVKTLNIASLYNSECVGSCSWTRTFTSVANTSASYVVDAPAWVTVTPTSFTILPGATQEVTFEVDATALPGDEWAFGNIEFLTDDLFAGGDPTVLVEQDFTEAMWPPTGWTSYDYDTDVTSGWDRVENYFVSSPASAEHNFGCGVYHQGWLVSPQFTVPADGITNLQFFQRGNWTGDLVYHGIMVSTASGDPAVGDFVELVVPPTPPEDAWTTTPVTVNLSAYVGQQIYVAFVYEGDCADDWWIDDVLVFYQLTGTTPISDVAVPVAVMPVAGNIPEWAAFETHRDTDSGTLTDLLAVEITDLSVDTFGFVKGVPVEIQLAQDPTNTTPFDDLSQVWYTLLDMSNGAARAVAEITATTASDIDLFWGFDLNFDGMPQEGELYEASATATAFEYLSEWGFPIPYYDVWVLVQNWQGSGAPVDDITLTLGFVGYDMYADPSMMVVGPETNAAFTPFALDVVWSGIDTEEGDRLYGLFDAYADADYLVPIGLTEVDVVRGADDVVKTADVATALPGDTVTYTIEITNYKDYPVEYTINDVLPADVTYVADSATGGAVYDSLTNAITWTGTIDPGYYTYDHTTSAEDPACTLEIMADGNPDAYLDWFTTSYGFAASASLAYGDSFWYGTFADYAPFNFYGIDYVGMEFTGDGFAGFDMASTSFTNQNLPNPTNPNNLMAMFWDDLYTQYDLATNKGVTMVGDSTTFATIEYDDVYRYGGDPAVTLDFEIGYFLQPSDAPGAYEIIFAYDNIHPDFDLGSSTIGVENVDGTVGTTFVYNDTTLEIEDGSAICFDYVFVPPTQTFTFQVTVDADGDGIVVNEALHSNDAPYTVEEAALGEFTILVNEPVINEYLADHIGTDVIEYVEIFGDPEIDYSSYKVLEIEGDSGASLGVIDQVIDIGTTDVNGLYLANLNANDLENGTISLLLVKDFTGAYGEDIDTDDDGVIDYAPWSAMADSVGVDDGGDGDIAYGPTILEPYFDGFAFDPGGASRIPDGYDTDAVTDWVRNDYDGAGLTGFTGTPIFGEAYNTPGEFNRIVPFVVYLPILFK